MRNNYFAVRIKKQTATFHFDNSDRDDIERAYELAHAAANKDAPFYVFCVPAFAGPWDSLGVVGHRTRAQILIDIAKAETSEDKIYFNNELELLDREFEKSGRKLSSLRVAA